MGSNKKGLLKRIIYYDFNNFHFSSFYLGGFISNSAKYGFKFHIAKKNPDILINSDYDSKWISLLFSVCLFKVEFEKAQFYFCIDTRDSNVTNPNKGNGYHLPLLQKVRYYFKVNYNQNAIDNDPLLRTHAGKILPIHPFFPVNEYSVFSYIPRILPSKSVGWTIKDSLRRLKDLKDIPTMNQMRQFRFLDKEVDVFLVLSYYNERKHFEDNEYRYEIMRKIQDSSEVHSIVGFANKNPLPGKYSKLAVDRFSISNYLQLLSKSRIAVYIRGLHNCISFKFGQLLCLGMPVIGQKIINNTNNLMRYPNFNQQFVYEDPDVIVGELKRVLKDKERLNELSMANTETFEKYFMPQTIVSDLLAIVQKDD